MTDPNLPAPNHRDPNSLGYRIDKWVGQWWWIILVALATFVIAGLAMASAVNDSNRHARETINGAAPAIVVDTTTDQ